jgi:DNA helicase IV
VLYVFHDPAQAIFRDDAVAGLGLATVVDLDQNCRNTQPIHTLIERFAEGGLATQALRQDGRLPELIEADGEPAMLEALGRVLHRLRARDGEDVLPWDIVVLTGRSLDDSAVWRTRRFGNEVLGNPAVDDDGRPLGLPAHLVPRLPDDVILCESIRRFKGLERPVVILVELRADDPRLERLLYVGASRATQHLVVIAPGSVLGRMR